MRGGIPERIEALVTEFLAGTPGRSYTYKIKRREAEPRGRPRLGGRGLPIVVHAGMD